MVQNADNLLKWDDTAESPLFLTWSFVKMRWHGRVKCRIVEFSNHDSVPSLNPHEAIYTKAFTAETLCQNKEEKKGIGYTWCMHLEYLKELVGKPLPKTEMDIVGTLFIQTPFISGTNLTQPKCIMRLDTYKTWTGVGVGKEMAHCHPAHQAKLIDDWSIGLTASPTTQLCSPTSQLCFLSYYMCSFQIKFHRSG